MTTEYDRPGWIPQSAGEYRKEKGEWILIRDFWKCSRRVDGGRLFPEYCGKKHKLRKTSVIHCEELNSK